MTTPPTTARPALLPALALFVTACAGGWAAIEIRSLTQASRATAEALAASEARLEQILAEVTRIRLEQGNEQKGPAGLLAKLRSYAPMLVSARTTAPDYAAAEKEMQAILRALESLGAEAWPFVRGRIAELSGDKHFDELKWLLEAAVRIDRAAGTELLQQILQGTLLPNPRMRWHAANLLLRFDKPLVQRLLRQVLETESSRGPNLERAAAYNLPIPDPAAISQTGFFNFVVQYIRSEDDQIEDTLLMVLSRNEHDLLTVQECIEELGRRKTLRAVPAIEHAYRNPPARVDNPIFLTKCLDAIDAIAGKDAVPFFTTAQRDATNPRVAQHLGNLLLKYR